MSSSERDEHGVEFLRRLAAGTAHDVNNLLVVVNGCAELALDDGTLSPQTQRLMRDILAAGARAAALTRQFLTLGRPPAGPGAAVDVSALLRSSESFFLLLVGDRIALRLSLDAAPLWVAADPNQLEQIVVNLALNARDAMPAGGTLSVTAGAAPGARLRAPGQPREADRVRLTVTDTGSGIDPAIRERIYEPYATTKSDTTHSGLGLAVVRTIVEQLGGSIQVTSTLGQGTTFAIDLPQAAAPGRPAVTS